MKKGIICAILAISLSLTLIIIGVTYKPSIHDATYFDLIQIDEIGEVKAENILTYLSTNPQASIDELVLVDYVGEVTVSKLKRRYK